MGDKLSGKVQCDNCDSKVHYMSTMTAFAFDMERVCSSCIKLFLNDGEWP